MENTCDTLVVGGGIIGLSIARELAKGGARRIVVLEKEKALGCHASGHNSGVLHAGLYYGNDTLKARFCSRGAQLLKQFVSDKRLPLLPAGKVLVATNASQLPELDTIYRRAIQNGIRVTKLSIAELANVEPTARTTEWALHSPETSVISPLSILEQLQKDLIAAGVQIELGEPVLRIQAGKNRLETPSRVWTYGHLINAAGLDADVVAHQMGVGLQYRILPFRGRYRKLKPETANAIWGLIYPIPDPRLPFLGVHLTKSALGEVWVGPTAEPALGRNHYEGLTGIHWVEFPRIIADLGAMTLRNASGLASHIRLELSKRLPGGLLRSAQALVPSLKASDFTNEYKNGLRAQLFDVASKRLVMDFVVEAGPRSTHILNAVSPGFTASFAFAEHVVATMRASSGQ